MRKTSLFGLILGLFMAIPDSAWAQYRREPLQEAINSNYRRVNSPDHGYPRNHYGYSGYGYRDYSYYRHDRRYERYDRDPLISVLTHGVAFGAGVLIGRSSERGRTREAEARYDYERYDSSRREVELREALAREQERNESVKRMVRNEFEGVSVKVFVDDNPEPVVTLAPGVTNYIEVSRNARIWALAEVQDQRGNLRLRQDVGVDDLPNGAGKIFYNPHRDRN